MLFSFPNATVVVAHSPTPSKVSITDSLKGDLAKIFSEEPRYDFFKLYNHIYSSNYQKKKTNISHSAFVHPTAFVSEFNVTIGEHVNIGPNATILPDISIGEKSFIGAGAVVTKDVPNNQVVYGVPARPMKINTLSSDLTIFDDL